MSFASEFKEFAMKGNVVDLAVGVIIGGAFGKIVDSAVKDLIMPVINLILGGTADFTNKYVVLAGNVPAGASLAEAQKLGLTPGGGWASFKDWPHVQLRPDASPLTTMSLADVDKAMKQRFGG